MHTIKQDEIVKKIAELEGWTGFHVYFDSQGPDLLCGIPPHHYTKKPNGCSVDSFDRVSGCLLPLYLNSIEEIIRASMRICDTEQKMRLYVDFMVSEMKKGEFTVNASATQRCKAMVKYSEYVLKCQTQ